LIHYSDIAINDEDDGLLALEDKSFADVFEPKPSSEVQMGELLPIIKVDTTMYVTFIYSSVSLTLLIYILVFFLMFVRSLSLGYWISIFLKRIFITTCQICRMLFTLYFFIV